jgi:hypothetical protein
VLTLSTSFSSAAKLKVNEILGLIYIHPKSEEKSQKLTKKAMRNIKNEE